MSDLTHAESIAIDASPEVVYDLISDIRRTGEWSPVCKECWWDEGATGKVGDFFTGRNVLPTRSWETHCEVIHAERGEAFGWLVGDSLVKWVYTIAAEGTGSRLTESWWFLPNGIAMFHERFPDDAEAQIATRVELAHQGIPETLAAIKRIAEAG